MGVRGRDCACSGRRGRGIGWTANGIGRDTERGERGTYGAGRSGTSYGGGLDRQTG